MRIGHGFDVHAFASGHGITLGGERIPFDKSLAAHSDGDVVLHALCDALLGAAALGDIGRHFPDNDPRYAGADSRMLLRQVVQLLATAGYVAHNADLTIVAQAPKLAAHLPAMAANIAADLGVDAQSVNVKATTTERLGFTGRGEGIAAHAVVLVRSLGTGDAPPAA